MSIFVKPTHPNVPDIDRGGYLAEAGREVEENQYWLRRLSDGDVTKTDPPSAGSFLPATTPSKTTRKGN